ncbi:HDOD domain-containing protein [Thiolapillus sp.]
MLHRMNTPTGNVALDFLQDLAAQLSSRDIELPPFPDVYTRILGALNDPDLSMDQLARMVTAAPDLCVRILLLANSALYNRAGVEVVDIGVAVSRLGVSAVRNATVSVATREMFDCPRSSPIWEKLERLRSTSVLTAAYACALADHAGMKEARDDAMLTGLLHNVGHFYILTKSRQFPEFVEEISMEQWMPGVGCALIENWGFPEEIARAVDVQNDPDVTHFGPANLADILKVAKLFVRMADADDPEVVVAEIDWPHSPEFKKLDIHAGNVLDLYNGFEDEVQLFTSVLK